jgi:hypothetical protein
MKFLIGILSGITLAGAGIALTSGGASNAAAQSVASQVALTPQSATITPQTATHPTQPASKQVRLFVGELSRKDNGFELKLTTLQNGETVDRDVRVLVAHARITNRAGTLVRLPLEDANARISAVMLPRSAWRLNDDGEIVPTLAAKRVIITPATSDDHTTADTPENAQVTTEVHNSEAD